MHRKSFFAIAAVLWKTNRTKLNKMRTKIYEQNQTKLEKVAIKPQKKKDDKETHNRTSSCIFLQLFA